MTMPGKIEIVPNREVLERGAVAAEMEHPAGHQNMKLLIQLRWLAVIGQISTIFGVGGLVVPFVGIKLIDMLLTALHLV